MVSPAKLPRDRPAMPAAQAVRTWSLRLRGLRLPWGHTVWKGRKLPCRMSGCLLPHSCHQEASPPSTVASGFLPFPLGPIVSGFVRDDVTDHKVCCSGKKQDTQWHQPSQTENEILQETVRLAVTLGLLELGLWKSPWRDPTLMLRGSPTS